MNCKLAVSELANRDLDEIIGYIVNDLKSPGAATDLLDEIEKNSTLFKLQGFFTAAEIMRI